MKTVKNKILYFTYEGKMIERNSKLLLQEIYAMQINIEERKLRGIFISLQNVPYDLNNLKNFLLLLQKVTTALEVPVCLGEYDSALYQILKKETKSTYIKLFKTFDLAILFLNTQDFKKKLKILMYDDPKDEEELDKQAALLTRFEHNIVYTKDKEEFQKKINDKNIDFAISQTKINLDKEKKEKSKAAFSLSKALVSNLPIFIDTAVENLEMLTGLTAKKTSHLISPFNKDIPNNSICAIMQFKGAIIGKFVLIFPKEVALLSIEAMLGEKLNPNDLEGISDGIGEFCNIITGGAKTKLSQKDIKVLFELPRTYTTITSTINSLSDNSGIWINMDLEGKPFYMYITT
ncbi:chemotaxis protein CheX [Sulfurospirillum arcachonense]|uniref:chemotaxis protein CheX n=1 Tax=Sulfurospirillum arcachonense TaxID=57666 RepID=UPI000468D8EF|nr:chemotaxis protein CheX [Sulfurospirillum arcachonense]